MGNFPGFPEGITGPQLLKQTHQQAERSETDIRSGEVIRVDFSKRPFEVEIDGSAELVAQTVIIATGARAKYLGLDGEKKYTGMDVSACATCDGFSHHKKRVAVVGGDDTAYEEILYLAGITG